MVDGGFVPTEYKLSKKSAQELYEGTVLIRKNAQELIDSAKKLGRGKLFGPANSLAILGAEECIKYFAVAAVGCGLEVPDEMTFKVFRYHDSKHMVGLIVGFISDFLDQTGILDFASWSGKTKSGLQGYETFLQQTMQSFQRRIEGDQPTESDLWWASANQKKNDGLYVGIELGKWISPAMVSKDDFYFSLNQAERLLGIVNFVGKDLTSAMMELVRLTLADGKRSGDMVKAMERHLVASRVAKGN
jgi:AbiV family abortive infection protein